MYDKLKDYLSKERLRPYLNISNNDKEKAIELYDLYMAINESFYISLQNIELAIRNSFCNEISKKYGNNWLLDKQYLLKGQSTKKRLLLEQIETIYQKYKKINNCNDIISNLSFNFWIVFLDDDFEITFWRPCLRKVFDNFGNRVLRSDIKNELKFIKNIRNRIFHHENLLKYNLMDSYNKIVNFIKLISESLYIHTIEKSNFIKNYENLKNFIKNNDYIINTVI